MLDLQKESIVDFVRCDVVVTTKYGTTLHQQSTDKIVFSTPVLTVQEVPNFSTRPFSKNGLIRNNLQAR